jgi:hypothetical protein
MAIVKRYVINRLKIIYPVSVKIQREGNTNYTVITSGTYTIDGGNTPAGVVMIGGAVTASGVAKTYARGGVAVLNDGRIVVARMKIQSNARQRYTNKDIAEGVQAIGHEYSLIGNAKVVDYMGGGAMVVEKGIVSGDVEMLMIQKFNQDANNNKKYGYQSAQLVGSRPRVAIGTTRGRADLLILDGDTQTEAKALVSSYENVVVFDGGNGFWAHDNNGYHSPPTKVGGNSTAFGVI